MNPRILAPLTFCLPLAAAACGQAELDEFEAAPSALVQCDDGDHFDFAQLSGNLAGDPALAEVVGLDRVETCDEARQYMARLNEHNELAPTILDVEERFELEPVAEFGAEAGHELEDFGRSAQAILNANASSQSMLGVVEVGGGCTGVLITERAILTAAHCVDDVIAPNRNAFATVRISRYTPTETQVFNGQVRVNIHPNYSGDGDTGDDIAVIKLFAPATFGFGSSHRTRIYTGGQSPIGQMRLYGRGFSNKNGTGSSNLRYMDFNADWWGTNHYFERAYSRRVCNGDSGGPTLDWTPNGFRVVAGLHSNSTKSPTSGVCAMWNGKQRSVRLATKITWIEDMLDVTCRPFTDSGWNYVRCW